MPIGTILNLGLLGLQVLPQLLKAVSETMEAVEAIGGRGTGDAKKAALLEAVAAAFEVQQSLSSQPAPLDNLAVRKLSSELVETVHRLQKAHVEHEQKQAGS